MVTTRVDEEFGDQVDRLAGTLRSSVSAKLTHFQVILGAQTDRVSLDRCAEYILERPMRVAALVDSDTDPLLLAALAGDRSMRHLAGLPAVGSDRDVAYASSLEGLAGRACREHLQLCRTDPIAARQQEARWVATRSAFRSGFLAEPIAAMEATFGAAAVVAQDQALGRRSLTVPPPGWQPHGVMASVAPVLPDLVEAHRRTPLLTTSPKPWPVREGSRFQGFDRVRPRFIARGGIGRAEQLARRSYIRAPLGQPWMRARLSASIARGPDATRQFLLRAASSPRRAATLLQLQLDPMIVAAALGRPAMAAVMAGRPVPGGGNLGRLCDALARADRERLDIGARDTVVEARRDKLLEGPIRGRVAQGEAARFVNQVWLARELPPTALQSDLTVSGSIPLSPADDFERAWQDSREARIDGREPRYVPLYEEALAEAIAQAVVEPPAYGLEDWVGSPAPVNADADTAPPRPSPDNAPYGTPPPRPGAADEVQLTMDLQAFRAALRDEHSPEDLHRLANAFARVPGVAPSRSLGAREDGHLHDFMESMELAATPGERDAHALRFSEQLDATRACARDIRESPADASSHERVYEERLLMAKQFEKHSLGELSVDDRIEALHELFEARASSVDPPLGRAELDALATDVISKQRLLPTNGRSIEIDGRTNGHLDAFVEVMRDASTPEERRIHVTQLLRSAGAAHALVLADRKDPDPEHLASNRRVHATRVLVAHRDAAAALTALPAGAADRVPRPARCPDLCDLVARENAQLSQSFVDAASRPLDRLSDPERRALAADFVVAATGSPVASDPRLRAHVGDFAEAMASASTVEERGVAAKRFVYSVDAAQIATELHRESDGSPGDHESIDRAYADRLSMAKNWADSTLEERSAPSHERSSAPTPDSPGSPSLEPDPAVAAPGGSPARGQSPPLPGGVPLASSAPAPTGAPASVIVPAAAAQQAYVPPGTPVPEIRELAPNKWAIVDDPYVASVERLPDGDFRVEFHAGVQLRPEAAIAPVVAAAHDRVAPEVGAPLDPDRVEPRSPAPGPVPVGPAPSAAAETVETPAPSAVPVPGPAMADPVPGRPVVHPDSHHDPATSDVRVDGDTRHMPVVQSLELAEHEVDRAQTYHPGQEAKFEADAVGADGRMKWTVEGDPEIAAVLVRPDGACDVHFHSDVVPTVEAAAWAAGQVDARVANRQAPAPSDVPVPVVPGPSAGPDRPEAPQPALAVPEPTAQTMPDPNKIWALEDGSSPWAAGARLEDACPTMDIKAIERLSDEVELQLDGNLLQDRTGPENAKLVTLGAAEAAKHGLPAEDTTLLQLNCGTNEGWTELRVITAQEGQSLLDETQNVPVVGTPPSVSPDLRVAAAVSADLPQAIAEGRAPFQDARSAGDDSAARVVSFEHDGDAVHRVETELRGSSGVACRTWMQGQDPKVYDQSFVTVEEVERRGATVRDDAQPICIVEETPHLIPAYTPEGKVDPQVPAIPVSVVTATEVCHRSQLGDDPASLALKKEARLPAVEDVAPAVIVRRTEDLVEAAKLQPIERPDLGPGAAAPSGGAPTVNVHRPEAMGDREYYGAVSYAAVRTVLAQEQRAGEGSGVVYATNVAEETLVAQMATDKVASALRLPYAPVADTQHGAEWQEVARDPAAVDRITRSADRLADQTLARVQDVSQARAPERDAQGPDLPTSSRAPAPVPAQRPAPVSLEPAGPPVSGRSDR